MRLYTKITLLIITTTFVFGVLVYALIGLYMNRAMEREIRDKGGIIAETLGEHITHNVLKRESLAARESIQKIVKESNSIVYAYIVGFDGKIFTHSFQKGFPRSLLNNLTTPLLTDTSQVNRYITRRGRVIEIAYPLVPGMAAQIRVGLNAQHFTSEIQTLRYHFLELTFGSAFFGILLSLILSRRIIIPLEKLAHAMKSFGEGSVGIKIQNPGGGREISELAEAFNRMSEEREQADRSLRQHSYQNELLLQTTMDGFILGDTKGQILKVNPAYCNIIGYSKQDLLGMNIRDLEIRFSDAEIKKEIEQLLQQKHRRFETKHRTKNGDSVDLEVSISLMEPEGAEPLFVAFVRDITRRKQREEERQRLVDILENTPDFTGIADINGHTVFVNKSIRNLMGFSETQDISQVKIEDYHPQETAKLLKTIGIPTAIKNGIWKGETDFLGADGKKVPTLQIIISHKNANGDVEYLSTIARDISEQKRTELILSASEQNYREIFNATSDAIFVHDAETGQIVDVNQSVLEMYNCTYEEALNVTGDDFSSCEPGYTKEIALSILKKVVETGTQETFEWHARKMSGETFWVEVILKLANITGNRRVLAVVRDITQRKQIQEELAQSEKKYRELTENINDIIYAVNTEGIVTYISPVVENISLYKQVDIIGKPFANFIYEEDLPRVQESFVKTISGQLEPLEYRIKDKNGNLRWISSSSKPVIENGKAVGTRGVITEITDRKLTETALQESEQRFRAMFHQNRAIMLLIDSKDDMKIIDANSAAEEFYGYSHAQLLSMRMDQINTLPLKTIKAIMAKAVKHPQNYFHFQHRLASGDIRDVEVYGSPITQGKQTTVFIIVHDITDRIHAQTQLEESEDRYRRLVEYNPAAILVHTKGKNIYVNAAATKLMGAKMPEELIGRSPLDFVHPDFQEMVKERIKNIYGKRKFGELTEEKFLRLDGKTIDVEVAGIPITYEGNASVLVVFWDITYRKQAEQKLKQSEQDYRGLFENAHDAIIIFEPENEIILDANKQAGELYGYPLSEFIGMSLRKASKHITRGKKQIKQTLKKGSHRNFESVQIRKDGSEMLVEVNSAVINYKGQLAILSINRDITERKNALKALKESEKSYRLLFDNAMDSIYVLNPEGQFLDVNRGAVKMYGHPKSYLIGKTPVDVSAPGKNDLQKTFKQVQDAFKGKPQRFEFWGIRKNGDIFPKDVQLKKGAYFGQDVVIAFARDITEQKRITSEIQALNKDLEQRVKQRTIHLSALNRELEAFSYSVSHDLRAPLRGINGFSQALLEDYQDKLDDKGKDYLQRVRQASRRMGHLIDDLIMLSRISREELTIQTVNLTQIAEESIADLQSIHPERNVTFKFKANVIVSGDKKLLRIAMNNLLGNAWKFTNKKAKAKIEFGETTVDDTKTYYVKDNGAGFDMEFADKLFGPFQRLHTQREFEGTGIGLATVQRIVHRHNGKIWARGSIDKGATFYFQLEEAGSHS